MAPAVEAGEYSIVILGSRKTRASSWDSWWMAQQYKSLARPVRKNVQLLVWVNPTSVTKVRNAAPSTRPSTRRARGGLWPVNTLRALRLQQHTRVCHLGREGTRWALTTRCGGGG
jgi:hypothetical protein